MWLRYVRVYAIANLSVVVCLFVVCSVRAHYSAGWNFPQCFYAVLYSSHSLTSMQNFTEIVPGEPLRRELNAKGVAKYICDVGHVDGYILEQCKIRPRVQLITNRKAYCRIQWYHSGPFRVIHNKGLGPQFGKLFISLKLMVLSNLTRR